jgi:hypothetical protein
VPDGFPFSRATSRAQESSIAGCRAKLRRGLGRIRGLDDGCKPGASRRVDDCFVGAAVVRNASASCQGQGRAHELSSLRSSGLLVGLDCSQSRNLGGLSPERTRNFGRIAPRSNHRFSGQYGFYDRAAGATSFLRDAVAVQHQLMFVAALLLALGCLRRVSSESFSY